MAAAPTGLCKRSRIDDGESAGEDRLAAKDRHRAELKAATDPVNKREAREEIERAVAARREVLALEKHKLPPCTTCLSAECERCCDSDTWCTSIGKCCVCDANQCADCMHMCFSGLWPDRQVVCETCDQGACAQCNECKKIECDKCMTRCSRLAVKAAKEEEKKRVEAPAAPAAPAEPAYVRKECHCCVVGNRGTPAVTVGKCHLCLRDECVRCLNVCVMKTATKGDLRCDCGWPALLSMKAGVIAALCDTCHMLPVKKK